MRARRLAQSLSQYEAQMHGLELELEAARRELERSAGETTAALSTRDAAIAARDAAVEQERRQRQVADEQRRRVRELEQLTSALSLTLAEVRRDIERGAASRAWRWGHFIATLGWRLRRRPIRTGGALAGALRRIERLEGSALALPAPSSVTTSSPAVLSVADQRRAQLPLAPAEDAAVARYRMALAEEIRGRIGPMPERDRWPTVTAIVVSHDGRYLLDRLFAGLIDHTDYPALEVVVIDNGSNDGSAEMLARVSTPFPLEVIATGQNLSFAQANALGVEAARGELLLFLNNDIEPFESGWLRELVVALEGDGVAAAGATLLHAEAAGAPPDAEPVVQHRGIAFRWQDDTVRPFNVGDGEPLWDESFGLQRACPAVTAACMLVDSGMFEEVGGFEQSYNYGSEDVDLGLKLTGMGRQIVTCGRSILVHRESSTQAQAGSEFRRANRTMNRRLLLERWGPMLTRSYRLGRLHHDHFWTDGRGPHVAITVTDSNPEAGWGDWYTAHEIGDALSEIGWRISYVQRRGEEWYSLPGDLDYVLSLLDAFDLSRVPSHVVTIAWIRNWTERWLERPWFDRIDLLLASSVRSAELIEQATGRVAHHFPLATNPARFTPAPPDTPASFDYVYTGNRWGEKRAVEDLPPPRSHERFQVFGRGWEESKRLRPYLSGPVAYHQLAEVYAAAKLVIDDTQGPTLPYGALNARVLDALACGALPVTDCVAGARELFDSDFPVWSNPEELREQLDELLANEPRRRELVDRYRSIALAHHTYAHRANELRDLVTRQEERLGFAVKIGPPDREAARRWGDLPFAGALCRELRRRGNRTIVQTLDEWEDERGLHYDVVIHLKGLSRYRPKPGQFNVLWSISHPDQLIAEECDAADLVCVASEPLAVALRARSDTPVAVLEQATDPRVFYPDPDPRLAHELVYVANSRNVLRPIMRDLLPTSRDLAVWGANWDGLIPGSLVLAEHVPNEQLRHIYSSAAIVLCDHWDDMRAAGYVSNRVYDALACGAFVICDDVLGLAERFGDAVVTYRSRDELHRLIDRFLADPDERRRRGEQGRELVLSAHTFAHVTDKLLQAIDETRPIQAGWRRQAQLELTA